MSTLISDSTSYATPADLLARFDQRDISQWCSDTTVPVPPGSLTGNANLLTALADASGMVEAAALASQRYTVTDLQSLATSGGNSAAFLKRIVCGLAVGMLMERRPNLDRQLSQEVVSSLEWLDQIRAGKRIFAFSEVAAAGNPQVTVSSAADVDARNLASYQARRYFGADRAQEFVPGNSPGQGAAIVP